MTKLSWTTKKRAPQAHNNRRDMDNSEQSTSPTFLCFRRWDINPNNATQSSRAICQHESFFANTLLIPMLSGPTEATDALADAVDHKGRHHARQHLEHVIVEA